MHWKVLLAVLGVGSCALAQWHLRAGALLHWVKTETYEHVFFMPPLSVLRVASLGHTEALADLLWVRGLIYLGEESIRNLGADHVIDYGNAVTGIDPYFGRAYRVFAINANSRDLGSEQANTDRIRASLAFLERGVKMLPNDPELAWDTGSMYAYTLAPRLKDEAEYKEAKRRGVEHMQAANLQGVGPPWAGLANASTLIRLGQKEQAAAHLQELYAITSDPDVRKEIEEQLAWLRSTSFMEGLRAVASDLERHRLHDFPYVSETLYLLLGPRPPLARSAMLEANFDPAFLAKRP